MTSHSSTPSVGRQPADGTRAHTLALQPLVNLITRGLLRTPLLCRIAGTRLITVYVVGRKSGRRFAVPVAYTRHEGSLLIGTPFAWGRNLRTGQPVNIRYKGRLCPADVEVHTDEAGFVALYAVMAGANRNFASFNQIGRDTEGRPDPGDLQLAWATGARAVRLTLR